MLRRLLAAFVFVPALAFAAEPLAVGVGTAEITPPLGYSMSGYFHHRGATGTLDPLLAKAIVFKQGDVQAALVVGDIISVDQSLTDAVREKIEQATGIPAAHISVSATHTHTGPNYRADLMKYATQSAGEAEEAGYIPQLIDGLAAAVIAADKNARPMTVKVGAGHEDRVSFNRRFVLKDGTVRTWARLSQPDVVEAAGPIDPEIGLIGFYAEGSDQPSSTIVNFALHCDTVGGTEYSADYPGHIERVLRKELGPEFMSIFTTGPCGDINHVDPTGKPRRSSAEIGEMLATAAAEAIPALTPTEPNLAVKRSVIEIPLQSYTDQELADAKALVAERAEGKSVPTVPLARAHALLRLERLRTGYLDLGRQSPEQIASPAGPRESLPTEVQVFRITNDTALVTLPGEIFVDLGLAIKEGSPFENTFVIELANSSPAYVPTKTAFEQGGYEANNSIFAPGGGEKLVETALELLNELDAN